MKEYKANRKLSKKCREAIQNCLSWHAQYKSCYFWNSPRASRSRRSQEESFHRNNPEFRVISKFGIIEIKPELSISCNNFYYSLAIYVEGKRKDVRILKKIVS